MRSSWVIVALACVTQGGCADARSGQATSSVPNARSTAAAAPPPFPSTAFTSDDDRGDGASRGVDDPGAAERAAPASRFETRRIGEASGGGGGGRFRGAPIDLDLRGADLGDVFRLLGEVGKVNIVVDGDVTGTVTLHLKRVPWDQALDVVARAKSLAYEREGNVIVVRARKN